LSAWKNITPAMLYSTQGVSSEPMSQICVVRSESRSAIGSSRTIRSSSWRNQGLPNGSAISESNRLGRQVPFALGRGDLLHLHGQFFNLTSIWLFWCLGN
jgi:hypothetical protein